MRLSPALRRYLPLIDALWLLVLGAYMLVGMPLATFHGDEAMQIHMSRDYVDAFLEPEIDRLISTGPYFIDSDPQLRILNGSVNRYSIGLSWHLAGLSADDLPPPPGWDWGLDYARNVETGHLPSEALLSAARTPSTLLLALSVVALFGIGRQVGGRGVAYGATLLYALNPAILLNGRRAMQEGSLLCFGLLVVLVGATIAGRRARGERVGWPWWLALGAAGALALASKHSAAVFVAGAFAWVLAGEVATRRNLAPTVLRLAIAGALAVGLFVAVSPALWQDPAARFGDLLRVRAELLDIQVAIEPDAPMPVGARAAQLVTQPFIRPVQQWEIAAWGEDPTIRAEATRYLASPLSGVALGPVAGAALMALAAVGLVWAATTRTQRVAGWGLAAWTVLTAASLMVNPLPWQRYYLPWIPVVVLLACLGGQAVFGWARNRLTQRRFG